MAVKVAVNKEMENLPPNHRRQPAGEVTLYAEDSLVADLNKLGNSAVLITSTASL
jgi:isoleucyl-tRNA synthetase